VSRSASSASWQIASFKFGATYTLETSTDESGDRPTNGLNYFNYFTEIEDEFARRRGKSLLISPMDWALVECWKNAGIPLHIVLRAINQAFDAYDARAHKHRKINSIFYCQPEVEATFAEYRHAQVGGGPVAEQSQVDEGEKSGGFPKSVLLDFLARCDEQLSVAGSQWSQAEDQDALRRARARLKEVTAEIAGSARVDAEALERDLDAIDRLIMESAARVCGDDEIQKIRAEAESQLRSYRKKMDKAIYEQTVQNFIARRLREMNNIPRLSLFYL
jgi:hypothetical protein